MAKYAAISAERISGAGARLIGGLMDYNVKKDGQVQHSQDYYAGQRAAANGY
jgi:hypothetical protein